MKIGQQMLVWVISISKIYRLDIKMDQCGPLPPYYYLDFEPKFEMPMF
jgi:hypothetical protein